MRPFCLLITPQSNLRFASSPAGEPFGCSTNSSDKPPSLREVDFAKQKTEGVSLPRKGRWMRAKRADGGVASSLLLFTSTPQSNLRFASSPAGEPFGCTLQTLA